MNNVKNVDVKRHIFGNFKLEELMNKVQYNLNAQNVGINGKMIDELLIIIKYYKHLLLKFAINNDAIIVHYKHLIKC